MDVPKQRMLWCRRRSIPERQRNLPSPKVRIFLQMDRTRPRYTGVFRMMGGKRAILPVWNSYNVPCRVTRIALSKQKKVMVLMYSFLLLLPRLGHETNLPTFDLHLIRRGIKGDDNIQGKLHSVRIKTKPGKVDLPCLEYRFQNLTRVSCINKRTCSVGKQILHQLGSVYGEELKAAWTDWQILNILWETRQSKSTPPQLTRLPPPLLAYQHRSNHMRPLSPNSTVRDTPSVPDKARLFKAVSHKPLC